MDSGLVLGGAAVCTGVCGLVLGGCWAGSEVLWVGSGAVLGYVWGCILRLFGLGSGAGSGGEALLGVAPGQSWGLF